MKASPVVFLKKAMKDKTIIMVCDKCVQNIIKYANNDVSLVPEYDQTYLTTLCTACTPFIQAEKIIIDKRAESSVKQQTIMALFLQQPHQIAKATIVMYHNDSRMENTGEPRLVLTGDLHK